MWKHRYRLQNDIFIVLPPALQRKVVYLGERLGHFRKTKRKILVPANKQYDLFGYWPMLRVPTSYEAKQRRTSQGDRHTKPTLKNEWSTPYEPVFHIMCSIRGSQVTARCVMDRRIVCRNVSHFKLTNAVMSLTPQMNQIRTKKNNRVDTWDSGKGNFTQCNPY